jgi:hypothetical protein
MKTKLLIILTLMLVSIATTNAQKKWNYEFAVGASQNTGNVDNLSLKNNSEFYMEDTIICFDAYYKLIYQKEDEEETNKGINGGVKFDFYQFKKWSTFLATEMISNHFKGYDFKTSALIGAKYIFHQKKDTSEYSLSLAFVYDNVNYTDENTNLNKENWRISIRPKISQKIGESLKIFHTTFYQPSIKDFGDYIVNTTTVLENKLSKRLFIDISFNYEYRSEIPTDEYKHTDTCTELTLKIKL